MSVSPRLGLLPLYLALYDEVLPDLRGRMETFAGQIRDGLQRRDLAVSLAPTCRTQDEVAAAVAGFEREPVDLLVTLHLAYSPSEESVDVLCGVRAPILMLDTTMDATFGLEVAPDRIMYNHGVHGVQDLASMLRRRGRSYRVIAGHYEGSAVLDRAADIARGAYAARSFRDGTLLRVGGEFRGMGDFAVPPETLEKDFGLRVVNRTRQEVEPYGEAVTAEDIEAEMAEDRERFAADLPEEVHRRSVVAGLTLRRCMEEVKCAGFSVNFLGFDTGEGPLCTVPFLEACKAMSRGIGYAGEGDVLTAALVGALCRGFGRTTFAEIFCPDWTGGSIFLSHMGEMNPEVAATTPALLEKEYPFSAALNPAFLTFAPAAGPAVFVNLAPGPGGRYTLVLAPVEMLGDGTHPGMRNCLRGWMRPRVGIEAFLEAYSHAGGTHHSALVLGDRVEGLREFGRFAGFDCVEIPG